MRRQRRSPPTNKFDQQLIHREADTLTQYLDDPIELASRFIADAKWKHKANLRMKKSEQLLTKLMARSNKAGHSNHLLSYHSKVLVLGGGDARFLPASTIKRKRILHGVSPKPQKRNPVQYTSPLLAPGGPRRSSSASRRRTNPNKRKSHSGGRNKTSLRPSSAAPVRQHRTAGASSPTSSSLTRPHSAHTAQTARTARTRYITTGHTPSKQCIRPYTAALPIALDLPWMRIKPEPTAWRSSWEPTQPLTYTPQQHLKPLVAKRKKRRKTKEQEHRVVDWARKRRQLLAPFTKETNAAAVVIQRFFQAAKHVGIRDRWMIFHAGEVVRRKSGAVHMQRTVRGHLGRLRAAKKQWEAAQQQQRLNRAATVIQNNWRVVLSRQRIILFRKVVAMRKRNMAKKIQRGFRKGSVGRGVQRMYAKASEFGKNAIVKMQGMFRGKLSRRKSSKQKAWMAEMKNSAVKVQSHFRGVFARRAARKAASRKKRKEDREARMNAPQTTKPRRGFSFFGKKNNKSQGDMTIQKTNRGFVKKKRKKKSVIKKTKKTNKRG